MFDPGLSRYPIRPHRKGYVLLDEDGNRLSFHRTKSGALRARLVLEREDQIDDRVFKMVDHLEHLLRKQSITPAKYNEAMVDLGKWAVSKRKETTP
jgi:hypothetical protein